MVEPLIKVEPFITDEESVYNNVVKRTFPNLNEEHSRLLTSYIIKLVQYIAVCFDFYSDLEGFRTKLKQENWRDFRWLLTYLLPYIDHKSDLTKITDLNDIYVTKKKTNHKSNNDDIRYSSPKYTYSNIQYNRHNNYTEINFDPSHIDVNYKLLLETINNIRNKLHINWIDVVPIKFSSYQDTNLYKYTKDKIDNNSIMNIDPIEDYCNTFGTDGTNDSLNNFYNASRGLGINDIYHVIRISMYESIVQLKWLMFDVAVSIETSTIKTIMTLPVIHFIKEVFNILRPSLINTIGNKWVNMSEDDKEKFKSRFNMLIEHFENKKSLPVNDQTKNILTVYHSGAIASFIRGFTFFFNQKNSDIFTNSSSKAKKYVKLPIKRHENDAEYYVEHKEKISDEDILKTVKSINIPDAFDFLKESIDAFEKTYYGIGINQNNHSNYSMNKNKTTDNVDSQNIDYISYKNIYNFCKSMIHYTSNDKYTKLPMYWDQLTDSEKNIFLEKINSDVNNLSWFNISGNIRYVENMRYELSGIIVDVTSKKMSDRVKSVNSYLAKEIMSELTDIIFKNMITSGVLTEMIAITELTNKDNYDISNNTDKKALVNKLSSMYFSEDNSYMTDCYYYLTSNTFSNVKSYVYDYGKPPMNYIKSNSSTTYAWYLATAYGWIAQTGFCHKFLHNRVNFVTGATGAGKSTQVPKMYMYFLKSLEYKNDATVLLTVPRTNVATGTSNYISKELSLPYDKYDTAKNDNDGDPTPNRTVQFKHMGSKKIYMQDGNYPKIRFITDGSVKTQLIDPFIWKKYYDRKDDMYVYSRTNRSSIYDVIIVDEAHEHNPNMDIVLSLMKNNAYYNNQIRLVVMSATMDADEPRYRSFYRCIDDNRKYPLSRYIEKHNLDRANTERRFHISPPDVGTRFNIDEIYYNVKERGGSDEEILDAVNEILATNKYTRLESSDGDILIFRPGVRDIETLVELLNNELPPNVITLPYHSKLTTEHKKVIEDIDEKLPLLRFDRTNKFSDINENDFTKGTSRYTRAIIVSTNIAEASITIPTLRYVIETGTEKTMKFNYKTRTSDIIKNLITNASRLQRKGRVGRKAEGTVYYMYEEGAMDDIVKQFTISVQDQHGTLYDLLRNENDVSIVNDTISSIVSGTSNLTNVKSMRSAIVSLYPNSPKFANSLADILAHMYYNGSYYSYKGNEVSSYSNPNLYFTGFDSKTLTDSDGTFYMIHFDELLIKRNINGMPVSSLDTDALEISNNRMTSKKIRVFWDILLDRLLCEGKYDSITKTELGEAIGTTTRSITGLEDPNISIIISYLCGLLNNPFQEAFINGSNITIMSDEMYYYVSVLCLLSASRGLLNMFDGSFDLKVEVASREYPYNQSVSGREKLSDALELFRINTITSDFQMFLTIVKVIENILKSKPEYSTIMDRKYNDAFLVYTDNTKYDLEARDSGLSDVIDNTSDDYIKIINNDIIIERMGINKDVIKDYIRLRENVIINILMMKNDEPEEGVRIGKTINDLPQLLRKQREIVNDGLDVLTSAIVLTNPYSIVRKIKGTERHYVSAYDPSINNIMTIKSLSKKKYIPSTFVDELYIHDYLYYHNRNIITNNIEMLAFVTPKYFKLLSVPYRDNIGDFGRYDMITINDKDTQEKIVKFITEGVERSRSEDYTVQQPFDYYDGYLAIAKLNNTIKIIVNDKDEY